MPRTLLDKVKTFENAFDIAKRVANRESSWTSEAKSMQSNRTQLCKFCKRLLGENFPIAQDIIPFVFDAKELKKETWKDIE